MPSFVLRNKSLAARPSCQVLLCLVHFQNKCFRWGAIIENYTALPKMPNNEAVVAIIGLAIPPPPPPATMYAPPPVNPTEECCDPSILQNCAARWRCHCCIQTPSGVLYNLTWMGKVWAWHPGLPQKSYFFSSCPSNIWVHFHCSLAMSNVQFAWTWAVCQKPVKNIWTAAAMPLS